nr:MULTISPECIES: HGGxSTG domain-containing protein [unclassified Aliiroseovarius]
MKTTFSPDFARARGGVLGGFGRLSQKSPQNLCGASTRKGAPCKANALPGKARCRFHGGASTGPKTPEGRERIAEAQRQRWAKWRAEKLHGN